MVTVYSWAVLQSSVWGGHAADGADHNEVRGVPFRAIQAHAFGFRTVQLRVSAGDPGGGGGEDRCGATVSTGGIATGIMKTQKRNETKRR